MSHINEVNNNAGFDQELLNFLELEEKKVWLKKKVGGFHDGNQLQSHIEGVIITGKSYGIKFINSQPIKVEADSNNKLPEGYKRAVDLSIQTDHTTYNLSIDNKTGLNNLAKYYKGLKQKGLSLNKVTTRLTVEKYSGMSCEYTAVNFESVGLESTEAINNQEDYFEF